MVDAFGHLLKKRPAGEVPLNPNNMRINRLSNSTLLALFFLAGCSTIDREASTMDLMSFNIRYGLADDDSNSWNYRRNLVFEVLKNHDAAIVGLQEALDFQIEEILAEIPAYATIGVGREADGGGEYSAILYSKKEFELLDNDTFWLSNTPGEPSASWGNNLFRICTWALFRSRANDREFYVYNTHFDHRSEASREEGARLIATRIASREHATTPFILMGDFNAGEDSIPIGTLMNQKGKARMVDTFRLIHPEESNTGTFGAWVGKTDGEKIDYIFADARIDVMDAAIVRDHANGRYPSDHYPITARLRF